MSIQAISNTLEELMSCINEAEVLASKENATDKERRQHNFLLSKISVLKSGVTADEFRNARMASLQKELGLREIRVNTEKEKAWRSFLVHGVGNDVRIPTGKESRANEAGTQSISYSGNSGYFVPAGFHKDLFEGMAAYDEIFDPQNSNVIETETGGPYAVPAVNDFSLQGSPATLQPIGATLASEATTGTEVDVIASQVQLSSYLYKSGMVFATLELLQDSFMPFATILEKVFARRFAVGVGAALVNGTGSAQPTGLANAVGGSPVIAAGSSPNDGVGTGDVTIGSQDMTALIHALSPAYRPGAVFYMSDSTLHTLDEQLDKYGRPFVMWDEGFPTYRGRYRIAICNSLPYPHAGAKTIYFGNPAYFLQRRVKPSTYCRRFSEAPGIAEAGMVGLQSFMRVDSNVMLGQAANPPFVVLQQHS